MQPERSWPPGRPQHPGGPAPLSSLAVASFVCALAVFCPFITSMAAIVLGTLALRRIRVSRGRPPGLGGRRLALAGTLIGSAALVVQLGLLMAGSRAMQRELESRMRAQSVTFVNAAAEGRMSEAWAACSPGLRERRAELEPELVEFGAAVAQRCGRLRDVRIVSQSQSGSTLSPQFSLAVAFEFERGEFTGALRYRLVPSTTEFLPRALLERIVVEDRERGDLTFPSAAPAPGK